MFAKNVGSVDRVLRVIIGLALIGFAVMGPETISWKWVGYLGVIPLLAGLLATCPVYSLLGIKTTGGGCCGGCHCGKKDD